MSPWWPRAVAAVVVVGFTILILLTIKVHRDAPPIPERVVVSAGAVVFTGEDILAGQQLFLKHGLMNNGSIWGRGGYLGPDISAQYLHTLALDVADAIAERRHGEPFDDLANAPSALKQEIWRRERNQYACVGHCFTRIFRGRAISCTNRIAA